MFTRFEPQRFFHINQLIYLIYFAGDLKVTAIHNALTGFFRPVDTVCKLFFAGNGFGVCLNNLGDR